MPIVRATKTRNLCLLAACIKSNADNAQPISGKGELHATTLNFGLDLGAIRLALFKRKYSNAVRSQ